jgi:hypothetical protein
LEKKRGGVKGAGFQEMREISRLTTKWITMAIMGIQMISCLPPLQHMSGHRREYGSEGY